MLQYFLFETRFNRLQGTMDRIIPTDDIFLREIKLICKANNKINKGLIYSWLYFIFKKSHGNKCKTEMGS